MLDGEHVYFTNLSNRASSFFFDNNDQLKGETETGEIFKPEVTVTEIIERYNWYVKKPFDVRAEMLARPNEWVGAFKDEVGWHKVGLQSKIMCSVETTWWTCDINDNSALGCTKKELDSCIPIEDVPEEELS